MSSPLIVFFQHYQIINYVSVSTLTLLGYDYVLTFQSEVKLVWRSKWSLTKLLFLVSRYSAFVDVILTNYVRFAPNLAEEPCQGLSETVAWMTVFGIGITEIILLVRTWAIWNRDQRVGYALAGSFICVYAVASFLLAKFLAGSKAQLARTLSPSVDGCFLVTKDDLLLVEYVLIIVFETAVLALTLAKLSRPMMNPNHMIHRSAPSLVEMLYRDGIWFYICLFGISLINVVVVATASHDFATLLACVQRALHSILASRLLLNLREASMRAMEPGEHFAPNETGPTTCNAGQSSIRFNALGSSINHTLFSIDDGMWMDGSGALGAPTSKIQPRSEDTSWDLESR